MKKRGQFYIIAAALIIVVLLGLVTVANKAVVQPKPTEFFDLSKDYEAETSKVIDYGTYNKYSPAVNITEKVENISKVFAETAFAKDPNIYLVFIYGNKTTYTAKNISVSSADISLNFAGISSTEKVSSQKETNFKAVNGVIDVPIAGNNYQFKLTDEENFYFIIQTTTPGGEKNVATRG
jgi:hypothetical protein